MSQYEQYLDHAYGPNVHILSDTFLLTRLGTLCEEATTQPAFNEIVCDLYRFLLRAVLNGEFPMTERHIRTRMASISQHGVWTGHVLDAKTPAVTVDILRAGSLPSQICFDYLNKTLDPRLIRQDHVVMARQTNASGQVIGTHLGDSKIGGSVDGAIVLFPDPMGATGGSIARVIHHYKEKVEGKAKKYVALNLIITPEYIRRLTREHPDLIVYAIRLDRGGSSPAVLQERPGVRWEEEIGLTDMQYIIPGGGGFGELMNNSYC